MGNLLYVFAVLIVLIWAIGFIGYNVGGMIHLLLVVAILAALLRVIKINKSI